MSSRRNFIRSGLLGATVLILPGKSYWLNWKELHRVLILGDSISIGYFPFVKELLKGKAMVSRPMGKDGGYENCQGTTHGVKELDRWLGDTPWDVIHFNFGLHDMKQEAGPWLLR
jgi:acyl-CoA thioesterase-1